MALSKIFCLLLTLPFVFGFAIHLAARPPKPGGPVFTFVVAEALFEGLVL